MPKGNNRNLSQQIGMNKKVRKFFEILFMVHLNPMFWISNYRTCKEHSKWIEDNVLSGNLPLSRLEYGGNLGDSTCIFLAGDNMLWMENYPYAFGRLVKEKPGNFAQREYIKKLPSRRVRYELHALLKKRGIL